MMEVNNDYCQQLSFIHSGSQFDKDGNLKMWWDDESFDKFDKNRQCIVDQYDAYKVPNTGLNVNDNN